MATAELLPDLSGCIYGNSVAVGMLSSDLAEHKLAHAYIVEGPSGSGKKLLSLSVCALMSDSAAMAKKIYDGICPDVRVIGAAEGRKTIGVDDVRAIRRDAYIKPNDLEFKAFVVDGCDCMTAQAQNALLKIIEEPPSATYFFLLCENSAFLLPTVRSRAPVIRMQVFEPDELKKYLLSHDERAKRLMQSDPEQFEYVVSASGGAIGAAVGLIDRSVGKKDDARKNAVAFLERILLRRTADVYAAVMSMPAKRDELSGFVRLVRALLRDLAAFRISREAELLYGMPKKIGELADKISPSRIMALDRLAGRFDENIRANVNITSAKFELASDICAALGL